MLVGVARYFIRLHAFSVTIPRCYNDAYVKSFFFTGRSRNFYMISSSSFSFFVMPCRGRSALHGVNSDKKANNHSFHEVHNALDM